MLVFCGQNPRLESTKESSWHLGQDLLLTSPLPTPHPPPRATPVLIHCGLGGMTLSINLSDILGSERAILNGK